MDLCFYVIHFRAVSTGRLALYNCCTLWHGVLYTRGGKWNPRRSRGCHFPLRVYKTHGPQSQRATIVLLYLCIIVIPLLEVLLSLQTLLRRTIHCLISRRTRNNFIEPAIVSYTARNRPTLGTIKEMYTRCTITFHVTRRVASHVTCVFVARHMIGSRPIKLHNLHRGITNLFVCLLSAALWNGICAFSTKSHGYEIDVHTHTLASSTWWSVYVMLTYTFQCSSDPAIK